MATTEPAQSPRKSRRIQPLPLSSKQEDEIKKIYNKNVRDKCADEIKGSNTVPASV
jgi:hypothetical protein